MRALFTVLLLAVLAGCSKTTPSDSQASAGMAGVAGMAGASGSAGEGGMVSAGGTGN